MIKGLRMTVRKLFLASRDKDNVFIKNDKVLYNVLIDLEYQVSVIRLPLDGKTGQEVTPTCYLILDTV